jgi:hypothetical protein
MESEIGNASQMSTFFLYMYMNSRMLTFIISWMFLADKPAISSELVVIAYKAKMENTLLVVELLQQCGCQ